MGTCTEQCRHPSSRPAPRWNCHIRRSAAGGQVSRSGWAVAPSLASTYVTPHLGWLCAPAPFAPVSCLAECHGRSQRGSGRDLLLCWRDAVCAGGHTPASAALSSRCRPARPRGTRPNAPTSGPPAAPNSPAGHLFAPLRRPSTFFFPPFSVFPAAFALLQPAKPPPPPNFPLLVRHPNLPPPQLDCLPLALVSQNTEKERKKNRASSLHDAQSF